MLRRSFPGLTDVHVQLYGPVIAIGSDDDWKVTWSGKLALIQPCPAVPSPVLLNLALFVKRSPATALARVALFSNVECGWGSGVVAFSTFMTPFDLIVG